MAGRTKLSFLQLIQQLLKDPDRKALPRIAVELIYLMFTFKTLPRHYFSRFLFKKDRINIKDYFPSEVLYKIKPHYNEKGAREVLENKLFFDFFYRQFKINLPNILIYNQRNIFVVNRMAQKVNTLAEFKTLLIAVFKITGDSIFIKRTYGTYGGAKIFKLYLSQLENEDQAVSTLFEEVIQTGYLFQETVKQHPEMNRLNPSCLNTIRLDTFIDRDGKIEIISGYLRTSVTNNYVDNITVGGCGIVVDLVTGKLKGNGYMSLKDGGINLQVEHPVTHTVFNRFQIPYFEQAKQLVLEVAGYMPNLRLIGWDIAIGESGPILIEGNSDYDVAGTDWATDGAKSNPIFRKVLKEINYLK